MTASHGIDWERLRADATSFLLEHPANRVSADDAVRDDLVGMPIFDAPIFAVGDALDPLFDALRGPEVVHPDYMPPVAWLPEARTVLAFFAPFTARIKRANAEAAWNLPADEWLHGRIEGEAMLKLLRSYVRDMLAAAGYPSVVPAGDPRFAMLATYAPNWSERHTGYICGLGTFGLSKGLITKKGVAGRIGSVVTACPLSVTARPYDALYAYCTRCGACAARCPVRCIDPTRGPLAAKAHPPCDAFLKHMKAAHPRGRSRKERYGCGKCQVGVPCQDGIPGIPG